MSPPRSLTTVLTLAALAGAIAAGALALPTGRSNPATTVIGPGMMGGYGGMMGGYRSARAAGPASAASPRTVRAQVESWLRNRGFAGFHVSEVMAFTNNDYVAVRDPHGEPAFELLTTPSLSWLMEQPPSMMWNSRYGTMRGLGHPWSGMGSMMGGSYRRGWNSWYRTGHGPVPTTRAAVKLADRWLAQARPGERIDADVAGMGHFPGYYTLDTIRNHKTVGMLSVNAATGAVWYHGWHGRFLREQEF